VIKNKAGATTGRRMPCECERERTRCDQYKATFIRFIPPTASQSARPTPQTASLTVHLHPSFGPLPHLTAYTLYNIGASVHACHIRPQTAKAQRAGRRWQLRQNGVHIVRSPRRAVPGWCFHNCGRRGDFGLKEAGIDVSLSRRLLKMQNWLHLNGLNCGTKDCMDNSIAPSTYFFSTPLDYIEILTFIDFLCWVDYLY